MLLPMFVMVLLVVTVLFYGLIIRIQAVAKGQVSMGYYRVFVSGKEVPERLLQNKNNLENLFQVPVLFYVACLAAMILDFTPTGLVASAWAYVGLRIGHSFVHLTYNNVKHRLFFFLASNAALLVMWIYLVIHEAG